MPLTMCVMSSGIRATKLSSLRLLCANPLLNGACAIERGWTCVPKCGCCQTIKALKMARNGWSVQPAPPQQQPTSPLTPAQQHTQCLPNEAAPTKAFATDASISSSAPPTGTIHAKAQRLRDELGIAPDVSIIDVVVRCESELGVTAVAGSALVQRLDACLLALGASM